MKKGVFYIFPALLFSIASPASENSKLDSLTVALHSSKGDSNTVILLDKIAEQLLREDPDSAMTFCDSARKLSEKINYKRGLATSLMLLANHNATRNRYKTALEYHLKALSLMDELGDVKAQVRIYRGIGSTYYGIHDYDNALKNYEQGLKLAGKYGMKQEIPGLLSNIGIIWHTKEDYGKAMNFYIRALKAAEANNDKRSRSYVLNSMGKLYFDIGKKDEQPRAFDQAINYYTQSLELKREMGDKKGMANTFGNMGEVQMERGRFNESLNYYLEGYKLATETDYKEWLETGCFNMANLYSTIGDFKNAYQYFREYSTVKDTLESISDRKAMADLQDKFDDERREKAIELLQKENEVQDVKLNRQRLTIWFSSAGMVIVLVFAFYIFRNYREKQKINLIIEEKNKNITDSIMYARRIQTAILPSQEVMSRSLRDFFVLYKPKDIVSGDFYFFTETKGKLIVAAADCTGHGVPGAFMSMIGNSLLNQIIKEKGITSPAEVLSHLHAGVSNSLNQNHGHYTHTNDGMDIALCTIDRNAKKIEYAGANRGLYFLSREGLREISADKAPIGGMHSESEVKYTGHTLDYLPGDTIYLCSDGYADQFGGPDGKKFRTRRLRELLATFDGKSAQEQKNILDRTITEWMGSNEQLDDILVIGVML